MRAAVIVILLSAVVVAGQASAYDPYDPKNCNGAGWDGEHTLIVAKVTASPRVHFIKSPYDDDFKAEACPSAAAACQRNSYLVTGDLVLVGRTLGDFTCVSYQSPLAKKNIWAKGWLPSAALTAAAPMPSPKLADWIGAWIHPGGSIEIKPAGEGKLDVEGLMLVQGAKDIHSGVISARVLPARDSIAFAGDGSIPFENTDAGCCRGRMRRIGPWLMVEEEGCGGVGVTFTGLYRRKN